VLEQIAAKNAGKVVVGRYDVHKQSEKAREFNVSAVPTLVILVDGGEVKRFVGFTEEGVLEAALGEAAKK
jgi:thioredoxin-like negative regulator of GroEL